MASKRPLVGVSCCTRLPEDPVQAVAERYLRTAPFMGADVVLVPAMSDILDIRSIVGRLDGILLTGSPSNVAPERYRSSDTGVGPFDPARDETTHRLIAAAEKDLKLSNFKDWPGYQAGLEFIGRRYCGVWGRGT
jgi:putative glutamine amidotransferase